jgi:plasmid maintenance system antidote protein VapI
VDLILCLYEEYGLTYVEIAEKFEVSPMNICLIVNGKTRSRKAGRVEHG